MNALWKRPQYGAQARKPSRPARSALPALVLASVLLTSCRHHPEPARFQPFDFVQMCDPQIGFTEYAADLGRFRQAVSRINALRPDLVVICGDLVNGANEKSFGDFNAAKARLAVPCYVAPGNHDIGNKPTAATLERYRRFEGKDYFSFQNKGCVFVVVNSQLWKTPVAGESEKQDAWLEKTLRVAARQHQRVFVVTHYPLFVKEPGEPDNYFNVPLEKRKELLTLFHRAGVVAVLAGHTHTTAILEADGIQMATSQNTSRNFDQAPYGFRVWHVREPRPYAHEFVPLSGQ